MQPQEDAVARYSKQKFGSTTSTPRILHYYTAEGWHPIWDPKMRLTIDTANELRDKGIVMVKVRHRLHTYEVTLARYLGA